MKVEIVERSNQATVLLQLLKEKIGIDTPIEKTTWQEISKKFGELMEEANKELRENVTMDNPRPIRKGSGKSNKKPTKSGKVEKIVN